MSSLKEFAKLLKEAQDHKKEETEEEKALNKFSMILKEAQEKQSNDAKIKQVIEEQVITNDHIILDKNNIVEEFKTPITEIESDGVSPIEKMAMAINKKKINEDIESERWNDPLRKSPTEKFVTFKEMDDHYGLFLQRIQQQMSSIGGGGEVNLRNLDDVNRSTIVDGNYLKYDGATRKFVFSPVTGSEEDTLNSVTTRGNTTNNEITVSALNIPVGSVLSGEDAIIANISNEFLSANGIVENGDVAALNIGDYGLENGITGGPYTVFQLEDTPDPALQVGDIVGGPGIPEDSEILFVGSDEYDRIIITNKNFAVGATLPEEGAVLSFAREIVNAGLSISTDTETDITINPGLGGHIVVHSDILPYTTKEFSLGSPAKRFKDIWVGPNTINILDESLGFDHSIGAKDGDLYISGGTGFTVGEWLIKDNRIFIKDNSRDVIIGTIGATADVIFNRAIKVETTLGRESFTVARNGLTIIKTPDTLLTTQSALSIIGSSSGDQYPRNFTGTLLQMTAQDGQSARLSMDTFGNGSNTYALIAGRAARGTVNAPSATQSGDTLFRISVQGYGETDFVSSIGRMSIRAKEEFTDSAAGTEIVFQTTPANTTIIGTSAKIDDTGLVLTGTTNSDAGITFRDGSRLTYFPDPTDYAGYHLGTDGTNIFWEADVVVEGAVIFKGAWSAANPPGGGTPTISDATGESGWQWIVSAAGTQNLGSGNITFAIGDLVIYDGTKYVKIEATAAQVQSNWTELNSLAPGYIQNKPTLFSGSYNDLTNKPFIPPEQLQSDWNQANNASKDFIKNKPTIPSAQVNSDWNSTSGVSQILNKPTFYIPNDFTSTSTTQNTTLTVDFNGPTVIFWQPSSNGNRSISLTNLTAGKSIRIFITPHASNNTFTFTGVTGSQCSNGSNAFQLASGGAAQSSMMIELFSTTTAVGGVWIMATGGI